MQDVPFVEKWWQNHTAYSNTLEHVTTKYSIMYHPKSTNNSLNWGWKTKAKNDKWTTSFYDTTNPKFLLWESLRCTTIFVQKVKLKKYHKLPDTVAIFFNQLTISLSDSSILLEIWISTSICINYEPLNIVHENLI